MKIYMELGNIYGYVRDGHLEGYIDFSKEEEERFYYLLNKEEEFEELTEEEAEELDTFKEKILDNCEFVLDDYELVESNDPNWKDLL